MNNTRSSNTAHRLALAKVALDDFCSKFGRICVYFIVARVILGRLWSQEHIAFTALGVLFRGAVIAAAIWVVRERLLPSLRALRSLPESTGEAERWCELRIVGLSRGEVVDALKAAFPQDFQVIWEGKR